MYIKSETNENFFSLATNNKQQDTHRSDHTGSEQNIKIERRIFTRVMFAVVSGQRNGTEVRRPSSMLPCCQLRQLETTSHMYWTLCLTLP